MPLSVEMPAPVKTTTRWAASRRDLRSGARIGIYQGVEIELKPYASGVWRFLYVVIGKLQNPCCKNFGKLPHGRRDRIVEIHADDPVFSVSSRELGQNCAFEYRLEAPV